METYSQFGQDLHVINNIYNEKQNGYFIEIGAYDGINMSNTFLLEKKYNWKGICIEPNPRYYNLLKESRKCINLDCALYKNDNCEIEFIDDSNGGCSGFVETNSHTHILNETVIKVKTKKLTTILKENNAPSFIEYLSIDTEGSEYDILSSHDFDKYKFGYISVEHNFIQENRMKIRLLLLSKGYYFFRENNVDDEYILIRPKAIFYNSKKAMCSIWESGMMVYNCLKTSNLYNLEYTEENEFLYDYDFAIVNEHFCVNNWVTRDMLDKFKKPTFCVVTEVDLHDNCIKITPSFYTGYIVLDSTIEEKQNIYSFGRPLEDYCMITKNELHNNNNFPIIGSFGFATSGKRWDKIVSEVQKDYDEALIRFNIPDASYVPNYSSEINSIKELCNSIITKPNIKLEITGINYTKDELINWCSQNTINCFFYERENIHTHGLCATTDQAIVSEKPLLVTKDKTFRHIHKYLDYYPNIGIKDAIDKTKDGVKKMKNDWSSEKFRSKFEKILFESI